jgi:DNA-binding HxlR family transcriptional regulator
MRKNAPRGKSPRAPRPNPLADCPLTAAFAAIGGKWKLTLVYWLAHGELHFAGLRRRASPISPKVLTEQLRELEADGIVKRTSTGTVPAPVIYQLSAYGSALMPLVESVRLWGESHLRRSRRDGAGPSTPLACAEPIAPPR